MKPFFISFSGKKQVGKDTATRITTELLEASGKSVYETAFAEPLKEMCITIIGLDRNAVYGTDKQKNSPSHVLWDNFPLEIRLKYSEERDGDGRELPRIGPMTNREVLQVVGTDIFRAMFDNDIWAKAPFRKDWTDYDVVILTDCRFPNEKEMTEANDGITIRLTRDTGFEDTHPSEVALDGFAFIHLYDNEGTIDELEDFVRAKLTELELL